MAYSEDLRKVVIRHVRENGGNDTTVPRGVYTKVGNILGMHRSTVKAFWTRFCLSKSVSALRHTGGCKKKLCEDHMDFLEYLVKKQPSISLGDLQSRLEEVCDIKVSKSTICRSLKHLAMTRKRLVQPAAERFSQENMDYTAVYLQVMKNIDVRRLKFFDESGFSLPDVCNPRYGHAPRGERALEVDSRRKTANITLNLMIGIDGVSYANIVDGASDMNTFIQYFFSAMNATTNYGDFALRPGDIVILDNCAIHHNHAEDVVSTLLATHGIEFVFLPKYSPHLNPVELCFQHIKTVLKSDNDIRNLAKDNLHYAIMHTVNNVTSDSCHGYFQHVKYLNT